MPRAKYMTNTSAKEADKNTNTDMNMIRFEILIDEVGKKLHDDDWDDKFDDDNYPLLDYFFEPQKFNPYAKIIYDKSLYALSLDFSYEDNFEYSNQVELFDSDEIRNNFRSKIRAMKTFCKYYDFDEHYEKLYALLFWAFMILTVDDSQKEEALAKISDFLTLLKERKKLNIPYFIYVIKYLYHYDDVKDIRNNDTPMDNLTGAVMRMALRSNSIYKSLHTPEEYFMDKGITKGTIKKCGEENTENDTWTCPSCGEIIPKCVGFCECGEIMPFEF